MSYVLRGSISNITPLTLDKTLTMEGASADAKAVGDAIKTSEEAVTKNISEHKQNTENPHKVTAAQLGLGEVDNTPDSLKPVSIAQGEAIADAKKAGIDAQTAADNAQTAANNAQTAANNAQTAADNAQARAEDAEKNAKDYADSKHLSFTVTLPASGWSNSAPIIQVVNLEGIKESDSPHWGLYALVNSLEEWYALKDAYDCVVSLITADGQLLFVCEEESPKIDLTIQLEVNR